VEDIDHMRLMALLQGLVRDDGHGTGAGHAGAGPIQSEDGVSPQDEKPQPKPRVRREYPDLVTREAAEDDADVFGEAWPLIKEWRELKDTHPIKGGGMAWLTEYERLLTVELLEGHGMTLPPEKQTLRGLDRSGQTNWRKSALSDTRRERERAELLNRATFGLLWR